MGLLFATDNIMRKPILKYFSINRLIIKLRSNYTLEKTSWKGNSAMSGTRRSAK